MAATATENRKRKSIVNATSNGQISVMVDGHDEESSSGRGGSSDKWKAGSDTTNMALLVLLYAMQGVPLGLTLGSIPFILKTHSTYTEIGLFSFAGYPYALKLLWSPIVDTIHFPAVGFRKSWVLPIQMTTGLLMIFSSTAAQAWLDSGNVTAITSLFFVFVMLAATQDIAVDGWALTLLSRKNIGHSSTCQTIGMNMGYFASFTIFLAFNDASFCNSYLRKTPSEQGLLSLSHYFTFWGYAYIIVTFLLLFKAERPHGTSWATPQALTSHAHHGDHADTNGGGEEVLTPPFPSPSGGGTSALSRRSAANPSLSRRQVSTSDKRGLEKVYVGEGLSQDEADMAGEVEEEREEEGEHGRLLPLGGGAEEGGCGPMTGRHAGVLGMYRRLWHVGTLRNIRSLSTILLLCKLGTITSEAAGVFKLMEKGVTRETVSLIVLLEFPLELFFALFAGRWASRGKPFDPWLLGYYLRLAMAALTTLLVAMFPMGATVESHPLFYLAIVVIGIATSFSSTLMFVSQGTFFSRISDSSMGGTYLTLLNTISNMGSAWPKFFVFMLMDWLTIQECKLPDSLTLIEGPFNCPLKPSATAINTCMQAGGSCVTKVDGFYPLSVAMVIVGLLIGVTTRKRIRDLESARDDSWRA